MRNTLLLPLALIALSATTPALAVDVDMSIRMPGVQIFIGDRDPGGRYWDGGRWRDERWWRDNCHRYEGRRDFRGRCEPRREERREYRHEHDHDDDRFCPPGQAKKGRC